jgi:circadian clock protein KaiC
MVQIAKKRKQSHLREFWKSRIRENGVQKLETGIPGFDELLEGGLPEGRVTLVSAGPGCGKTILLNEFLYRGASEFDQPGIFLTFEERPEGIRRNLSNFDWALDEVLESGQLVFLDGAPQADDEVTLGPVNWFEPMLARIDYMVKKIGAQRLAIDNLGAMFLRYPLEGDDQRQMRERLFYFFDRIKKLELTTLVSTESENQQSYLSKYNVDEFVSEGLIELSSHTGQGREVRNILVRKLRGCGYRSGSVQFEINQDGMQVYPRIPLDSSIGDTNFSLRGQFGVDALDQALGGGIPQGHIMLVAGNTGTGKTTLGLHYIKQGLECGENTIWVALEEPVKVVLKTAQAHGWDLSPAEQDGRLLFVTSSLIDVVAEKLLYAIIDAVNSNDAKRIVVDSVSSLESSTMDRDSVREFMLQLAGFAKTQGITVVLNYLSDETFGAMRGQLLGSSLSNAMRLSSIVDGVVLLRYVERKRSVEKLLNVLKLRGSDHDKRIFNYDITQSGFVLGEQFEAEK